MPSVSRSRDAALVPPLSVLSVDELLESVLAADREIAALHARSTLLLAELHRRAFEAEAEHAVFDPRAEHRASSGAADREAAVRETLGARIVIAEIAVARRLSESSVRAQLDDASRLTALPAVLAALGDGMISPAHARALAEGVGEIPVASRAEFEALTLPTAISGTPAAARRRARRVAAELLAFGDVDDDSGHAAGSLSSARRRGRYARFHPTVSVTVPVLALLGHSDEPATLDGYGPFPLGVAEQLAASAPSFTRILTHPETGTVLSVGRTSCAVPADLRRLVRLRDERCRFPGCERPAPGCDIDHTRSWEHGGETAHDNLACLCRTHHRLKHASSWQVSRPPGRTTDLVWTSPYGRVVTDSTDPPF